MNTAKNIKKVTTTRYIDEDENCEYVFMPIDDTLTIEQTKDGYKAKYLTYDEQPMSPDEWDDESLFLVHYHRQFWVTRDSIKEADLADYFRGDIDDEDHYLNDYYIFLVSAYIHSGVALRLGPTAFAGQLPQGHYEFDVSRCGAILASKKEFANEDKARKTAEGLISEWNSVLSGDVYCCVVETWDKDKGPIDYDVVGGYIGFNYAKEALKTEF